MANAEARNLVLRTVYLPSELDQELKVVAFREDQSKNEIVRELILEGIASLQAKGDVRFVRAAKRPSEPVRLQPLKRNRVAKIVGAAQPVAGKKAVRANVAGRRSKAVPADKVQEAV
ncbi:MULTISPECIES: hypothetical protein [Methylobacteriaceae]|uniref:hypothetical protein n=1 Tax=Methylobacteriaceae TaxID=119045 RepID=UPI0006FB6FB0|nr:MULTISPECIES: hypothetical protein [Methylobacteriaceae]KQQ13199.1 hypothetical protein ASF53_13510 [Methylobacterium sp. Leaf123]MCY1643150.1 hypothetical protein [Methylorubrum sp. SL192]